MKSIKSHLWCFETRLHGMFFFLFFFLSDSRKSHTPSSPAKGTPHSNKNTGTQTHFTRSLQTHKSSQLPSARSWETEKQWTSVTPPEINTTIYREKEKMVCLCACKRIMDFEVDGFQWAEKKEEAGVNVKVDHRSPLFIVLLVFEWLPQVNRYHYGPLCRTERETAL